MPDLITIFTPYLPPPLRDLSWVADRARQTVRLHPRPAEALPIAASKMGGDILTVGADRL
jgi:hypothetical protein